MSCEHYVIQWDSKRLRFEEAKAPLFLDADNAPADPMQVHSCLGDDNKIWCEAYRAPGQPGGIFLLRDFDELLLTATAKSHMDFVQGLDHFARLTSNVRYAADIFEHNDDEAEE